MCPFKQYAQCIDKDIIIDAVVCDGQNLNITNNSDADEFIWDTCSGELDVVPNAGLILNNREFARSRALREFEDRGQKYLFSINNGTKRITFLNFGNSYFNNPTLFRAIDLRDFTDSPQDLSVVIQDDRRYIFVSATNEQRILKLSFGNSWFNNPVISFLDTSFSSNVNGITIIPFENEYLGFVMQDDRISRLSFGASVDNDSPTKDEILVPDGDLLRYLKFVEHCGAWAGIVTSYTNGRLIKLNFDSDLPSGVMSVAALTPTGIMSFPSGLSIAREGDSTYIFVQGARANLYRSKFDDIDFTSLEINDLGRVGTFTQSFPVSIIKEGPLYIGFTADHNNRQLMSYIFPVACDTDQRLISGNEPLIALSGAGTREVSVHLSKGLFTDQKSFTVDVSADLAPAIDVNVEQFCAADPVNFSFTEDPVGLTINWSFGDGNVASGVNVQHTYATTGTYEVIAEAISGNGCINRLKQQVIIRDDIQSDFSIPSSITCTNQDLIFLNESRNTVEGETRYRWFIDNVEVADTEDLSFRFASEGTFDVQLEASINGCISVSNQSVTVLPGALPSFTAENVCLGNETQFHNLSSGAISSYNWDFGDGMGSSLPDPSHVYTSAGTYNVTLTLASPNGCVTQQTQQVVVHAQPVADFENDLLCANSTVQFRDTSTVPDANITSWNWDFGAAGTSDQQNPAVVFPAAGSYIVSLEVTSEFGCSQSEIRTIEVLPSPEAMFEYDALCAGEVVQFTDLSVPASGTTITEWAWNLGGNFSGDQNPTATFDPGTYIIELTVSASNQCIGTLQQNIEIGSPLQVEFTVEQPCIQNTSILVDRTISEVDEIVSRSWQVDGEIVASDSATSYTFENTGPQLVSLEITTDNGCVYSAEQLIDVQAAPEATFTITPESGSAPLEVIMENTTESSIGQRWSVDGAFIGEESPINYVFTKEGFFMITMETIDPSGCVGISTQEVRVGEARMDLAANNLRIDRRDVLVELENRGNVPVSSVPLVMIAENGETPIIIATNLSPGAIEIVRIPEGFSGDGDLCVTIDASIDGLTDVDLSNNSGCILTNARIRFSHPYPNPGRDLVTIDVAVEMSEEAEFVWVTSEGKQIKVPQTLIANGFGRYSFDISGLARGVYYLKVIVANETEIFRIVAE